MRAHCVAAEEVPAIGKNALLLMTPEVGHGLIRVVEEHTVLLAGGDLVAPPRQLVVQLAELSGTQEIERREDVDGPDIRGHVPCGDDVREPELERGTGSVGAQHKRGAGERSQGARVPETAAGERGHAALVALTGPVRDEIHEPAVAKLHVQEKVEHAERPVPHPRQAGRGPHVGEEDQRSRRVIDARDALVATLRCWDGAIGGVGVYSDRESAFAGRLDGHRESGELTQHG
jgi:hypothetical protein